MRTRSCKVLYSSGVQLGIAFLASSMDQAECSHYTVYSIVLFMIIALMCCYNGKYKQNFTYIFSISISSRSVSFTLSLTAHTCLATIFLSLASACLLTIMTWSREATSSPFTEAANPCVMECAQRFTTYPHPR